MILFFGLLGNVLLFYYLKRRRESGKEVQMRSIHQLRDRVYIDKAQDIEMNLTL